MRNRVEHCEASPLPDRVRPKIYIVVPCYNEEEVLPHTARHLWKKLARLMRDGVVHRDSRILLADDGSTDATWDIARMLHDNPRLGGLFTGLSLSHNRGHQNVLYAALMSALERGCDAAISIDADLQDDLGAIDAMIEAYKSGANIVYGVRSDRSSDTRLKRGTANMFYGLMRRMGTETIPNSADFRLMDATSLEALSRYGEANLFLRGIVPSLGFRTEEVYYVRRERIAGESKYPLSKMLGLAVDGITSFSVTPLRVVTGAGFLFVLFALLMLVYAIVSLVTGRTVSGWTSLLMSMWFVGGSLMLSLGVLGEYVGRTYLETKGRPRYIVAEELD